MMDQDLTEDLADHQSDLIVTSLVYLDQVDHQMSPVRRMVTTNHQSHQQAIHPPPRSH